MFNVGPTELLVILLLALLVFGPSKLPEVGRSVGRGLREFRRATDEVRDEIQRGLNLDDDDPPVRDVTTSGATDEDEAPEVTPSQTIVEGNGRAPEGNGRAPDGSASGQAD